VDYGYTCANGADTRGSARHCWTYTYGSCGGSPPVVVPGGGSWDVGGGSVGGTSSPSAPAPKPITGVKCFPSPIRKEAYCGDDCALSKETRQGILQEVHSQVNLVLGEYTRDHTDLSVKAPGGVIAAGRRYYANAWHFEHTRHNLILKPAVIGTGIESIEKAGVIYTEPSLDSDLFIHDIYRIRKSAAGKQGDVAVSFNKRHHRHRHHRTSTSPSSARKSVIFDSSLPISAAIRCAAGLSRIWRR
jgi:hypothetical protein